MLQCQPSLHYHVSKVLKTVVHINLSKIPLAYCNFSTTTGTAQRKLHNSFQSLNNVVDYCRDFIVFTHTQQ